MANPQPQDFLLDSLPDPPANMPPGTHADEGGTQEQALLHQDGWRIPEWRAILEYRGFGFQFTMPTSKRKHDYYVLWRKIQYYTQGGFPTECVGAVGPGTLKDNVRNQYNVPSHYMAETAAYNYFQLHDRLKKKSTTPAPPINTAWFAPISQRPQPPALSFKLQALAVPVPAPPPSAAPIVPPVGTPQGPINTANQVQGLTPPATGRPPRPTGQGVASTGDSSLAVPPPPAMNLNTGLVMTVPAVPLTDMAGSLKDLLISFLYSSLERLPAAQSQQQTATTSEALFATENENTPRTVATHVRLRVTGSTYVANSNGQAFRFLGKGPIWRDNSCHLDSIICSAIFLNAGLTAADRAHVDNWEASLNQLDRAFLEVVKTKWELLSEPANRQRRHDFWTQCMGLAPAIIGKIGRFGSPVPIWERLAMNLGQFKLGAIRRTTSSCPCGRINTEPARVYHHIAPPRLSDVDANGVTAQTLIQRWFELPGIRCGQCETDDTRVARQEVQGELPLRLVVEPTNDTRIIAHTSRNITINHDRRDPDTDKTETIPATFRWIGGIYCAKKHFRCYFNDNDRGDTTNPGQLRVYDGQKLHGAIIGGLPCADDNERVPADWMVDTPSLLFYERVIEPSTDFGFLGIAGRVMNSGATGMPRPGPPFGFVGVAVPAASSSAPTVVTGAGLAGDPLVLDDDSDDEAANSPPPAVKKRRINRPVGRRRKMLRI